MGFDDIRSAIDVHPSLTTIRQDVSLLGERAAEILLTLLADGDETVEGESVPVELIVRESTSPVDPRTSPHAMVDAGQKGQGR
jgi:LacI family transcriptional regulator